MTHRNEEAELLKTLNDLCLGVERDRLRHLPDRLVDGPFRVGRIGVLIEQVTEVRSHASVEHLVGEEASRYLHINILDITFAQRLHFVRPLNGSCGLLLAFFAEQGINHIRW